MKQVEPTAELSEALTLPIVAPPIAIPAPGELPPFAEPVPLAEPLPPDNGAGSPAQPNAAPAAAPTTTVFLRHPTASRRLVESLILFVVAILFLRSMAVEPFGVPTGSMAPTLTGNHKVAICPRCGYRTLVGEPGKQQAHYPHATCGNCGKPDIDISEAPPIAGDRLLVDKNVYALRRPRRWEPAVFHCPAKNLDNSEKTTPYVKRVVGLPGEKIQVVDGDIYVDGRLARKTLVQAFEMRVPIFDMNFPPRPEGWASRWALVNQPAPEAGAGDAGAALTVAGGELRLDGGRSAHTPVWAVYKHHRFDGTAGIDREEVVRDVFVYNGLSGENDTQPVHDFLIEFELEVLGGSGTFYCRLSDGHDQLTASCPVGANGPEAELKQEGFGVVRSAPRQALEEKKKYRVRMTFVDRRVSFAIDGRQPFQAHDLDPQTGRSGVISPLTFGIQGANVIVRDLKIYRDVYYRSSAEGRAYANAVAEPLQLGPDEYFMLGDNSANSEDSRAWAIPGVPERNFMGKPFLLHQPSRIAHLTIGRWERTFPAIDWSRIRLLR